MSCSATVSPKPALPVRTELCTEPTEPLYDRIDPGDSREVQFLKLLNNITRMRTYILKLKAANECLRNKKDQKENPPSGQIALTR